MQEIIFDRGLAIEIMERAYTAYHAKTHLYRLVHALNGDAPQSRFVPRGVERGSMDHLLFLYFAALTDRRQLSSEVYRSHVGLWATHEWLYREELLERVSQWQDISVFLKEGNIGVPSESARSWLPCSNVLHRHFDGDPRKLYAGGSIDAALAMKKEGKGDKSGYYLPGFGPKILSLLAIFYEELGVVGHIEGAFPVDVHIQRIFISAGVVSGSGLVYSAALAEFLRPRICEICYEKGWKPLHLSHALWFLGNQVCTKCYKVKDARFRCPVFNLCGGAIDSRSYFRSGRWDLSAPRRPKACANLSLF